MTRYAAHAFGAIPTDQYDEMIIYDLVPHYGLSFYPGKDVDRARSDTVIDELLERDARMWVVDLTKRAEIEDLINKGSGRVLSQVGRLQFRYLILQEKS